MSLCERNFYAIPTYLEKNIEKMWELNYENQVIKRDYLVLNNIT